MEKKTKKLLDTKGMVLCALFAALIAVGAFLKIPIPYVPITLQFLFTNLAGLLLGKKRGLIAVCVYIFVGLVGIPVFTQGGGLGYVFQPTFGYIIGFALGTWLAGLICEHGENNHKTYLLAGFANFAVVFAIGLPYYYLIVNYYLRKPIAASALLISGFLACAPGDIVIVVVSAFLAVKLHPIIVKGKA